MARHKVVRSPRLARKARKKAVRNGVILGIFLFVCIGAGIYALLQPVFRIRRISVDGSEALPKDAITAFIREHISGSYLGILPKDHILFYPAKNLEAGIERQFPTLARVDLSRENLSAIRVAVVSREPEVIWCQSERCFFMDKTGFVFAEAPETATPLYYHFIDEQTATSTPLGTVALDPTRLGVLFGLATKIDALGQSVSELHIEKNGEVTVLLGGGAKLLFGNGASFDDALSRLEMLLSEKGLVPRRGETGLNVDYIDLRYGNKIYFK